jgi:pyridoxal 5-phosphate dependent beta-lyase
LPVAGQDVLRTRARLLEDHDILTSVCLPWRAPQEMTAEVGPLLRLSPHVDLTADDLERACRALGAV